MPRICLWPGGMNDEEKQLSLRPTELLSLLSTCFPRHLLGVRCYLMLQVTAVMEKNKFLPSGRAEIPANKC